MYAKLLQSYPTLCTLWTVAHQAPLFIGFPGKNTRVAMFSCCYKWHYKIFYIKISIKLKDKWGNVANTYESLNK